MKTTLLKNKAIIVLSSLALLTAACGGQTPEAESPADGAEADEKKPSEPVATATEAETAEPEAPVAEKPSPRDILLKDGTAFMVDNAASDMGKAAEEKCAKKSGDDVAKNANCMSKAINAMEREGYTFVDDEGEWWFVRFAVIKNRKQEYNRIRIDEGTVSGNRVTFKTQGKDKGSRRRGRAPDEVTFIVEDEYSIVLEDPKRGKLVLEPKMGLFKE